MDTSKAWLWGRIREREREREREGAALVELKAFGRKSGAASCLSCQLLSAVYLLQVFRIHRGGDVKARRGETRECEQLKTVFLSSSPPHLGIFVYSFSVMIIRLALANGLNARKIEDYSYFSFHVYPLIYDIFNVAYILDVKISSFLFVSTIVRFSPNSN